MRYALYNYHKFTKEQHVPAPKCASWVSKCSLLCTICIEWCLGHANQIRCCPSNIKILMIKMVYTSYGSPSTRFPRFVWIPSLFGWTSTWRRIIDRYEEPTHHISATASTESIMLYHKVTECVGFLQAYHVIRAQMRTSPCIVV